MNVNVGWNEVLASQGLQLEGMLAKRFGVCSGTETSERSLLLLDPREWEGSQVVRSNNR